MCTVTQGWQAWKSGGRLEGPDLGLIREELERDFTWESEGAAGLGAAGGSGKAGAAVGGMHAALVKR